MELLKPQILSEPHDPTIYREPPDDGNWWLEFPRIRFHMGRGDKMDMDVVEQAAAHMQGYIDYFRQAVNRGGDSGIITIVGTTDRK